jgi:hypothetical protein
MVANSSFHRWRHAQRLVNPTEIVVHVMKRDSVLQILSFFRESICEPRELAHRHAHREVLAFRFQTVPLPDLDGWIFDSDSVSIRVIRGLSRLLGARARRSFLAFLLSTLRFSLPALSPG